MLQWSLTRGYVLFILSANIKLQYLQMYIFIYENNYVYWKLAQLIEFLK